MEDKPDEKKCRRCVRILVQGFNNRHQIEKKKNPVLSTYLNYNVPDFLTSAHIRKCFCYFFKRIGPVY